MQRGAMTRSTWLLAACWGALGTMGSALAADLSTVPFTDPATRMQDGLRRAERAAPPAAQPPAVADSAPLLEPRAPTLRGTVRLQEVVFSPSELLEAGELNAVAQPYLGRDVSSDDLNAFLRAIQALYLRKGVQTAVPVLPQQDLQSGSIRVLLVEGKLGEVTVQAPAGTDPRWVARWFDLPEGAVIRPDALASRLSVFNAASDFGAQAAYVPGAAFGRSDLLVQLPDAAVSQVWALFEMPDVGAGSQGSNVVAGYRRAPLSAQGGRVDLMGVANRDSATLSLAGSLPLGAAGWRLGANGSVSRSRSTYVWPDPAEKPLDIRGESSSRALELAHHQAISARQLLRWSGSLSRIKTNTTLGGELFTDRSIDRFTLAASTDWPAALAGDVVPATLRAAFTTGKGLGPAYHFGELGGTLAFKAPGAGGPVWRLGGQWRFAPHNPTDLSDRWQAGGAYSVRGFGSGAVSGERGVALQLSLHQPLELPRWGAAEVYSFADMARASTDGEAQRIAAVGVGFQVQLSPRVALDTTLSHQTTGFQGERTRLALRASATW
jgi:hemolysin activation/secretion protein